MVYFEKNIQGEVLEKLPLRQFGGDIWMVDTIEKFEAVWPLVESSSVYGFDTETKPSFSKGKNHKVSLLQLADNQRSFLFRLNLIGVPPKLQAFLSDPNWLKIGASVHDDHRALNQICKLNPNGFIDLQVVAPQFGIEDKSLKKMSGIVLGFRISKSQQLSNWEAPLLTPPQQYYAATDAWVCYEMYYKFKTIVAQGNGFSHIKL